MSTGDTDNDHVHSGILAVRQVPCRTELNKNLQIEWITMLKGLILKIDVPLEDQDISLLYRSRRSWTDLSGEPTTPVSELLFTSLPLLTLRKESYPRI